MPSFPVVLTVEAVAERLLTTPEKILAELEAGRLEGIRLGEEWRITEVALFKFVGLPHPDLQERSPAMTTVMGTVATSEPLDFESILDAAEWQQVEPFDYQWPDGKPPAHYDEVYEAHVQVGYRDYTLRVAMGTFDSFGDKQRRRGVVFLGSPPSLNPLVEFAGENSPAFAATERLASIVKVRSGQHLKPGHAVPPEYRKLPLDIYNKLVVGPYAAGSMAVVAHKSDLRTMAHHALIRAHWKGLL
jgi:hypothetical protein